jgi:predicted hydrocarbon binding protein
MLPLPTAPLGSQELPLHNYYESDKFLSREPGGRLLTKYQQRAILVTEDFIVGFQLALEAEVGDAASQVMYRCGFEWGRVDMVNFEKRMNEEFGRPIQQMHLGMVLEQWWWPLQAMGWGAWSADLTHKEEGLIYVDLYDSAIAKSVGNIGRVVCHYYAGMFAAAFSHLAARELSGIEIQCYSMGEAYCKFLIGSAKRINAAQFWVSEGAKASEIISRL